MSSPEQIPLDFNKKRTKDEIRQSIMKKRGTREVLDEEEQALIQEELDFDREERGRTGSV